MGQQTATGMEVGGITGEGDTGGLLQKLKRPMPPTPLLSEEHCVRSPALSQQVLFLHVHELMKTKLEKNNKGPFQHRQGIKAVLLQS